MAKVMNVVVGDEFSVRWVSGIESLLRGFGWFVGLFLVLFLLLVLSLVGKRTPQKYRTHLGRTLSREA